jgi:hypothetical protein
LKRRLGEVGEGGESSWACTRRREKERRGGGAGSTTIPRGRDGSGHSIRGGSVHSRWRRAGEQERAVGRGRRSAGAADRWGRVATGPGGNWRVWERAGEKSRAAMGCRQAGPGGTVLGSADSNQI